jgi:hypothetical protein
MELVFKECSRELASPNFLNGCGPSGIVLLLACLRPITSDFFFDIYDTNVQHKRTQEGHKPFYYFPTSF